MPLLNQDHGYFTRPLDFIRFFCSKPLEFTVLRTVDKSGVKAA